MGRREGEKEYAGRRERDGESLMYCANDNRYIYTRTFLNTLAYQLRGHDRLIFCVRETSHHLVRTQEPTSEVMAERDVNRQAVPQTVFHPSNTALSIVPAPQKCRKNYTLDAILLEYNSINLVTVK